MTQQLDWRIKDLRGQVFGALKVLRLGEVRDGRAHWVCKCLLCKRTLTKSSRSIVRYGHCGECGYRHDAERHKTIRMKLGKRRRQEIARLGHDAAANR